MAKRGRKPVTGAYTTRDELEEAVVALYAVQRIKMVDVARLCRVSVGTASKILDAKWKGGK